MTTNLSLEGRKKAAFDHARAGRFEDAANLLLSVLKQAPHDLGSLLLLGDVRHAAGKTQDASRAYTAAMQAMQLGNGQVAPGYQQGVQRAQARLAEYARGYDAFIESELPKAKRSKRFDQSVDILLGKSGIYLQQPTKYYFPGLPQIQFYDTSEFDWVSGLEAKTADIKRELMAVLSDHAAFKPYLERDNSQPNVKSHELVGNDDWSAFYLWKDGERVEENCARCPVTAAAFDNIPLDRLPGQAPSVLFSLLKPGAQIPPHHGLINTRLICHLPVLVPGPAWLRVGNEVHHWQEGKVCIFDDSVEHEAKNEADQTRVVLLFDIWRPELSLQEREEVTKFLGAISAYSGEKVVSGN
ncbi:aspartyl/asparaginyl beta-hydroxylase domain-containing protein [uncultured Hyphomonas sp.]|uniref:aspartyl/asparaginyl beta-hydroxylase domain-containing protein n=1 Tax=uncultured Hyphomonas sp. TaxID=225298 RepID=UPI002AABA98B|nr:aspartyl/asparaginyl beta-hydroxylase domain-containing protein [uncultured Hyphomonas sp.]